MTKKKKRTSTPKNEEFNLNEALGQLAHQALSLTQKGVQTVEDLAKSKDLHKNYPYLDQAFSNVKGFLGLLTGSFERKVEKNERKTRKKRTTRNKKVSK